MIDVQSERLRAELTVRSGDGVWRITGLALLEEQRL